MKIFLLKSSLVKKFPFWFFDCYYKTTKNLENNFNSLSKGSEVYLCKNYQHYFRKYGISCMQLVLYFLAQQKFRNDCTYINMTKIQKFGAMLASSI